MPSSFDSGKDIKPGQDLVAGTLLSTSVLEAIPDAVAAVNQQGFIIQVNSQTESLFGYTRDELIGQRSRFRFPGGSDPGTICTVNSFISSRRSAAWDLVWIFMAADAMGRNFP
jgi:PAS domain-containing protein